jgi:hypothetical protein
VTAVRMYVLTCDGRMDGDECPSAYRPEPEVNADRVAAVRRRARSLGWRVMRGRDLCPDSHDGWKA